MVEAPPPPTEDEKVGDLFFTIAAALVTQLTAMMEPALGRAVDERDLKPFTLVLLDGHRGLPVGADGIRTDRAQ